MHASRLLPTVTIALALAFAASAAPPEGKGGGKDKGGGGNDGGDPPAEFVPAIAYFTESNKSKDIQISNVEGDQACLVQRFPKGAADGDLSTFSINGRTKRMVYGRGGNIYLATWTNDPCNMSFSSAPLISAPPTFDGVGAINSLDFSPDGNLIVWTLNPTVDDDSRDILIYDFNGDGSFNRIDTDYWARFPRFSPQFSSTDPATQELFFTGRPANGSRPYNVYSYQLSDGAVRTIASGLNFSVALSVSNPNSSVGVRIAAEDIDNGQLRQYDASGSGSEVENAIQSASAEMAYSCDNSQIIFRFAVNWKNNDAVISARDGSSARTYSTSDLRDFDWICP